MTNPSATLGGVEDRHAELIRVDHPKYRGRRSGISHELVLVANHRPEENDRTPAVVQELARGREEVRSLTLEKQGAMGWDMRTGLDAARGAHIVVMDGDAQTGCSSPVRHVEAVEHQRKAQGIDPRDLRAARSALRRLVRGRGDGPVRAPAPRRSGLLRPGTRLRRRAVSRGRSWGSGAVVRYEKRALRAARLGFMPGEITVAPAIRGAGYPLSRSASRSGWPGSRHETFSPIRKCLQIERL